MKRIKKKIEDTTQLERELLFMLLGNIMILRKWVNVVKDYWFTDDSRLFIYDVIKKSFVNNKSVVSRSILEYEIDKTFDITTDKERISDYKSEITLIYNSQVVEKIELIIEKINEADLKTDVHYLLENSYQQVMTGNLDEALRMIKSGALNLTFVREKDKRAVALHGEADKWKIEVINRKENPEKYAGIKTGLGRFDDLTGGLFKAELTVVFGLAGKGKSTVMKNICSNVRRAGYNVLHVANEENEFQVQTKYHALETTIEYNKFKRGTITDQELTIWEKYNNEQKNKPGEIYVLEISQGEDASVIERVYYELEQRGIKIDLICIDYMDLMGSIRKVFNENDEQAKITSDCKQLAINCDVPVLSATQAGTHTEKMETKENPFLTAADIYGTKRKAHSANTLIGLVNKTATVNVTERNMSDRNIHHMVFCVPKNRDGPVFTFKQLMYTDIGRLEDDNDYDPKLEKIEQHALAMSDEAIAMEEAEKAEKAESDEGNTVVKKYKEANQEIDDITEKVKRQMYKSDDDSDKVKIFRSKLSSSNKDMTKSHMDKVLGKI